MDTGPMQNCEQLSDEYIEKENQKLLEEIEKKKIELEEKSVEYIEQENLNKKLLEENEKKKIELAKLDKVKTELEEKLKDANKLIHSLAERSVEIRRNVPVKRAMEKACKVLEKADRNVTLLQSEVLSVNANVQDIQRVCNECRAKYKQENETAEKTIQSLEACKINQEFIIQQLTHKRNEQAKEIEELKKEKASLEKKNK